MENHRIGDPESHRRRPVTAGDRREMDADFEEYGQRTNVVVSGDRPILFEHHHVDVDAELDRIQERLGRNGDRPALAGGLCTGRRLSRALAT